MAKAVPNNVHSFRTEEGLSVAQLGRLSNLSDRTVRKVEKGEDVASITRHRVVKGFNAYDRKTKDYTFAMLFPNNDGR